MVSFASPITSSSVSNLKSGASGPKVSSVETFMSGVMPVTTVGSKNVPPSACRLPPVTTFPPPARASAICSSTFSTAASLIKGPVVTPSFSPSPTFSFFTAAASFVAKAS